MLEIVKNEAGAIEIRGRFDASEVGRVEAFLDRIETSTELDLSGLGFKTLAETTGRPGYHPAVMLKLYIYGYLKSYPVLPTPGARGRP